MAATVNYCYFHGGKSKEFAGELVKDVKARVDKRVGTLAHDGWKNLDVKKVNTAMLTGPHAFFVSSDTVDHNDIPTLVIVFFK